MVNSLYDTFNSLIHSKRFWATLTSVVTAIGGMMFPQYLTGCLTIIAVLQTWVLGETVRPIESQAKKQDFKIALQKAIENRHVTTQPSQFTEIAPTTIKE